MSDVHALRIEIVRSVDLPPSTLAEIIALCNRAYHRDLSHFFPNFQDPTHVIGFVDSTIACHAMWVTRWLQAGDGPLLRTAYVEMVATDPVHQRRGYASAIMRGLVAVVQDFDLACLCPSDAGTALYPQLGWEHWRGPLSIRSDAGLLSTPEERVMIMRLPGSPQLDLDQQLSAEWRMDDLW
jgi:aminoglycoside 2'-N-acetyltransferase I